MKLTQLQAAVEQKIQISAYLLWEDANGPWDDDWRFWFKAEFQNQNSLKDIKLLATMRPDEVRAFLADVIDVSLEPTGLVLHCLGQNNGYYDKKFQFLLV